MSQKVDSILRMVAQINSSRKAELMHKVSRGRGGFGGGLLTVGRSSWEAIGFAPRSGAKCPAHVASNITKHLRGFFTLGIFASAQV